MKRKTKKKIKNRIPRKNQADYEDEIVALNRELADVWTTVSTLEDHQKRVLDSYNAMRENFKAIKKHLLDEIQVEENELEDLQSKALFLEAEKQKQVNNYEEIVKDLTTGLTNGMQSADQKIEDKKITLKILKCFERRRDNYLQEKEGLLREEVKIGEIHKRELYEEDREIRLEEAPLRSQIALNLETIFKPLRRRLQHDGFEIIKQLKSEENERLWATIQKNGCRLVTISKKLEHDYKTEQLPETDCTIGHKRTKKRSLEKSYENNKREQKMLETDQETQTTSLNQIETVTPLVYIRNVVEDFFNVDPWVQEETDEYLERQENIFQIINKKIVSLQTDTKKHFVARGFQFEKIKPNRLSIMRSALYRNLRQPKRRNLLKLNEETGILVKLTCD